MLDKSDSEAPALRTEEKEKMVRAASQENFFMDISL
jgi:hypothetical protein